MYDLVLFDLDGTLTDPKEGITKCVQYALASFGINEPNLDNLICFIGPPLKTQFMEYCGFSNSEADEAIKKFRERFEPVGIFENRPYEGIHELLGELKANGMTLAVATNKPTVFAKRILERYDLIGYFDAVEGCEMNGEGIEKWTTIEKLLNIFNHSEDRAEAVVMVGDRKHDIVAAKTCGIDSIGLRMGYAASGELEEAGATYIADDLSQLKELLINK